jgi:curved DNA-binding protein CbpA
MLPDLYRLLGVRSTATQKEIKSAHLAMARRYHPDVNRAQGASDHIKSVNAAYETLGDPTRRANYAAAQQYSKNEDARRAYEERMRNNPPKPKPPPHHGRIVALQHPSRHHLRPHHLGPRRKRFGSGLLREMC